MIVHTAKGGPNGTYVYLWCPGCETLHAFSVDGTEGPQWTWDGDRQRPTFSPSLLVRWHGYSGAVQREVMSKVREGDATFTPDVEPSDQACHSFVRAGRWQFLSDSTHALAGQTVDCVPIPEGVF